MRGTGACFTSSYSSITAAHGLQHTQMSVRRHRQIPVMIADVVTESFYYSRGGKMMPMLCMCPSIFIFVFALIVRIGK